MALIFLGVLIVFTI